MAIARNNQKERERYTSPVACEAARLRARGVYWCFDRITFHPYTENCCSSCVRYLRHELKLQCLFRPGPKLHTTHSACSPWLPSSTTTTSKLAYCWSMTLFSALKAMNTRTERNTTGVRTSRRRGVRLIVGIQTETRGCGSGGRSGAER